MTDVASRSSQLFADDLEVGVVFEGPSRTIGLEVFDAFARLTGDDHPLHRDELYAAKTRFGRPLAHGLLTTSMTALGATDLSRRLEDSMIAFLEQAFRFRAPVFCGDVLRSRFRVADVRPRSGRNESLVRFDVSVIDQSDRTVADGHHVYLIARAAAPDLHRRDCA